MLHAELHGKLAEDATDSERREDVLTSTVFGTLFAVEAWEVLARWLGQARPVEHSAPLVIPVGHAHEYWFWPRLDGAEPDVVVRLENLLLVIEAKFHSGKSGKDESADPLTPPVDSKDQLVREWRACSSQADLAHYPDGIRRAITSPNGERALVYLVKRIRAAPERSTVCESLAQVPGARMYLLTWEDLDEVLAPTDPRRWVAEMRAYLQRKRLSAFRGFASAVTSLAQRTLSWRFTPDSAKDLRSAFAAGHLPSLRALGGWRGVRSVDDYPPRGWHDAFPRQSISLLGQLAQRNTRTPHGDT